VFPGTSLPEPPPEIRDRIAAADADPDIYWRRVDAGEAIWREMERVCPAELAKARGEEPGFSMSFPRSLEDALRVLRTLPDGAGAEVLRAALKAVPGDS
jgi:hypothetical protein